MGDVLTIGHISMQFPLDRREILLVNMQKHVIHLIGISLVLCS